MDSFYRHHVFFCTHQRDDGKPFCEAHDASDLRNYAKQQVKDLGLQKVRINNAGCLNRCALGPVLVVYPEGVWYRYKTKADIDEIIQSHVIEGKTVKRLKL